jgi:hypothetical protein
MWILRGGITLTAAALDAASSAMRDDWIRWSAFNPEGSVHYWRLMRIAIVHARDHRLLAERVTGEQIVWRLSIQKPSSWSTPNWYFDPANDRLRVGQQQLYFGNMRFGWCWTVPYACANCL